MLALAPSLWFQTRLALPALILFKATEGRTNIGRQIRVEIGRDRPPHFNVKIKT
jgi:hypothetical protein